MTKHCSTRSVAIWLLLTVMLAPAARSEPPSAGDALLPKDVFFDRDANPLDVALIRAALRGDMPGVEHIVQTHPEVINAQPSVEFKGLQSHCDQWSALHWAVARNDRSMVEFLVKHGADPNGKVRSERPPLGMVKSERLARILIDAGADVNAAGWDGEKPLHDTTNGVIARMLIEKGAKIDDPGDEVTKDTPLHCAARYDRLDVARVLVEYKANINVKNWKGTMPLHDACHTGDVALVTLLIEHGADVRAADQDGTTPVMCAARGWGWKNQSVDILQLLAKHGASLATKMKSGETLLHLAAQSHLVDAAKFLIESGLDVNARTGNGVTALHCAAQGCATSDIDMVKLLLEHRANVNAVALAEVEESTPSQTAYVTKKITPLGYAMSIKHFAPIQTDIPGVWKAAEENVKQINRTRKVIADILRQHGAQ